MCACLRNPLPIRFYFANKRLRRTPCGIEPRAKTTSKQTTDNERQRRERCAEIARRFELIARARARSLS